MHGKQTWNKGSGQEYNNMILKGWSEVHCYIITIKGVYNVLYAQKVQARFDMYFLW